MKTTKFLWVIGLLGIFFFNSCDGKYDLKDAFSAGSYSTGYPNTITVVGDTALYKAQLGEFLHREEIFGTFFENISLPSEPRFLINSISETAFPHIRKRRNIIQLKKGKPSFSVDLDSLAIPQSFVVISGNSAEDFKKIIQSHRDSLVSIFEKTDKRFAQLKARENPLKDPTPLHKIGVDVEIPNVYSLVKSQNNFCWFRNDFKEDILNILVYKVPFKKDSIGFKDFSDIRDSIGITYLRGVNEDYSQVSKLFPTSNLKFIKEQANQKVYEAFSYWEMTEDMMGGPLFARIILDEKNQMLYIAEAFIYAPYKVYTSGRYKKRDYLIQLEGILETFKLRK